MNDEIKEILDKVPLNVLQALGNLENGALNYYKSPKTIEVYKNTILDYITNLEECHKNMFDINLENDKLIWDLQNENERLKEKVKHYEETVTFSDYVKEVNLLVDYKSRNEKAVEYLKDNACYTDDNEFVSDLRYDDCEKLLNILNGRSDE